LTMSGCYTSGQMPTSYIPEFKDNNKMMVEGTVVKEYPGNVKYTAELDTGDPNHTQLITFYGDAERIDRKINEGDYLTLAIPIKNSPDKRVVIAAGSDIREINGKYAGMNAAFKGTFTQ